MIGLKESKANLSAKITQSFGQIKSRVVALKSKTPKTKKSIFKTLDLLVRLAEDVLKEPDQAPAYCVGALNTLLDTFDQSTQKAETAIAVFAAREITITELNEFFDINFDRDRIGNEPWCLENEPLDVPQRLRHNLRDLREAFYYESEATCRIAVDAMLVQCCLALRKRLSQGSDDEPSLPAGITATPQTPRRGVAGPKVSGVDSRVALFPELDISVKTVNRYTREPVIVQGRADWAFGYGTKRRLDGNVIAAMEAKQTSEFSKGEAQLLAYLAILRENRHRAGKINTDAQGFWTDGTHYTFMCIRNDGVVGQSEPYNIVKEGDLKTVFNFIVTMFETAVRSTPNVSPTKPGHQRDGEIGSFSSEVWDRAYTSYKDIAVQLVSDLESEEYEESGGKMETDG
ncbi:MAG: hypothetical protein M1839_008455 [Geoglossum umbratile]|nr:MAG: hypothetical protein M1839_008455 [Geoglossum umbratile]